MNISNSTIKHKSAESTGNVPKYYLFDKFLHSGYSQKKKPGWMLGGLPEEISSFYFKKKL